MCEIQEWKHKITSVESKYKYVVREENKKNNQSSYQLGKDVGDFLINEQIVKTYGNKESTHQNYKLDKEYSLILSPNIKKIIGNENVPKNPDVIFTKKSDGKFDIRKSFNKEENSYWFNDLYRENTVGEYFIVKLDQENKKIEFDVEQIVNFDYLESFKVLPKQQIFFGAPGTGKSYTLNTEASLFEDKVKRITFHPNILYNDFVGTFKPFPTENPKIPITYKYIPGVLIKSLLEAFKNPFKNHLIIIEEINRANVSAVFGEMFQLLDRDSSGRSQYPIDINEDLKLYINDFISDNNLSKTEKQNIEDAIQNGLIFPSNLFIWATMNSADQGVMPMDTAFKRRWDFRYFSIDHSYNEEIFSKYGKVSLPGNKQISWNEIRKFLNDKLSSLKIPEDKLLGPYFLSKMTLSSNNYSVTKAFKNKVLMYLFEDIGVHNRAKIFDISILRYSNVINEFEKKGIEIFYDSDLLYEKIQNIDFSDE
ncbi:hypothetical protein BUY70_03460 [Staphylococcus epidermidis]|uniref:AAA family ATPase n=1 Tax=Staphylococcus epidermidis TaxID=1282 RepID=UPI000E694E4C|nr:AAA family ATPase [Staphylococcus epidermidis]RIL60874.1 hypothetical protein BUY70_03460 [Staphylococcus epidermidis]